MTHPAVLIFLVRIVLILALLAPKGVAADEDVPKKCSASREGKVIMLLPSGAKFEIPEAWIEWDAQYHDNIFLSSEELVKFERDAQSSLERGFLKLLDSTLDQSDFAAQASESSRGGHGLIVRAYVTDDSKGDLKTRTLTKGSRVAKENGTITKLASKNIKDWLVLSISYEFAESDYFGTAQVRFFIRSVRQNTYVLAFMKTSAFWDKGERERAIVDSFKVPG